MTNHHGAFGRGLLLGLAVALLASAAVAAERSDEWIKTKAEITLYAMPDVEPSGITVSSKHGYVTLTGAVPTASAKTNLLAAVNHIEGVRAVQDQLQVSSVPPEPKPNPPGTTDLRGEVVKKLSLDRELRDNSITVDAQPDGVVVLSGFANSLTDQLRALKIARGVTGVASVRNDMKSPPDTLYDMQPAAGAAQGADTKNRLQHQALEGISAEPPPPAAGDAPARVDREDKHPAEVNPEGDTTHSPRTADE
jgi:osmotically-inducible protein OsmY